MAPKQKLKTTSSATSQPSESSEIVASNDDLLKQILLKLPLKSLVKFTSVSKHWLSLISGPDFSHRRNPSCSVSGLFIESPWNITEFKFVDLNQSSDPCNEQLRIPFRCINFLDNSSQIEILQSCNGLLLCSTYGAQEPTQYYVVNPTTRTYAILPPLPFPYRPLMMIILMAKTMVLMTPRLRFIPPKLKLGGSPAIPSTPQTPMVSRKECFGMALFTGSKLLKYVRFNVDEERLGKMPVPPSSTDNFVIYFVESGGHLYLIYQLRRRLALPGFDIYEMEMNYSGWFLKFRVDLSEFPAIFLETFPRKLDHKPVLDWYFFKIVYIASGDVDEEAYAVIRIPGMVIRYNFTSKAFDKLCDVEAGKGATRFTMEWGDAHQYIESLALV